jgi:hypothetical protein
MVGFDAGVESYRLLNESKEDPASRALENAKPVGAINANLTAATDLTQACRLLENAGICFQGPVKVGPFEIEADEAGRMLAAPNPHGRPNSDVVRPWLNASDITGQSRDMYIVDFGSMPLEEACLYEAPFEYIRRVVKPKRDQNRRGRRRDYWWQHGETVPAMRSALAPFERYVATPRVAKHRVFVWVSSRTLPDSRLYVFARADDCFFGILQSRVHEVWALATSSRHGVGNDPTYNNTTCFETFPFPWPPGQEPVDDPRVQAIAAAAADLVARRDAWLNPVGSSPAERKQRTLTALYNARPAWLDLAHRALDAAVLAAYDWPTNLSDDEILERLLALNLERTHQAGERPAPSAGGMALSRVPIST